MTTLIYYDKKTGDLVAQLTVGVINHAKFQEENPNLGFVEATVDNLREWHMNLDTMQLERHIPPQPLI